MSPQMTAQNESVRSNSVLIVDDHEDTRQMSVLVLQAQGFQAFAAKSGEAAFVRACEEQPDVIVTDLAMPDGDGWELIQKLSADPRTKEVRGVVVAAGAPEAVRRAAANTQ